MRCHSNKICPYKRINEHSNAGDKQSENILTKTELPTSHQLSYTSLSQTNYKLQTTQHRSAWYRKCSAKNVDVRRSAVNRLTTNENADADHHITGISVVHFQAKSTSLSQTHRDM